MPSDTQSSPVNRGLLRLTILVTILLAGLSRASAAERPNILWFVVDDMSANFSCYGETTIATPAVDQLAAEGLRFTRAYVTSPVCSTFRSALITGMYQTSIGAHHHRSGRGKHRIQLPKGVRPIPELFQAAGYWTCNGSACRGSIGPTTTSTGTNRSSTATTGPGDNRGNRFSCSSSCTAANFAEHPGRSTTGWTPG